MVKQQVDSQIKVRDFSNAQVTIQPSEFSGWSACRTELMIAAKRPLKAEMNNRISNAPESKHNDIRVHYDELQENLEHKIDFTPMEMQMSIDVEYNFLAT